MPELSRPKNTSKLSASLIQLVEILRLERRQSRFESEVRHHQYFNNIAGPAMKNAPRRSGEISRRAPLEGSIERCAGATPVFVKIRA